MSDYLTQLRKLAPSVAFNVSREVDDYAEWDGDGPDPREEGYQPYTVQVTATTITEGQLIEEAACLGSCYYKDDEPIGDIHGYLLDMLDDVIDELSLCDIPDQTRVELALVSIYLEKEMVKRHEEQQEAAKAARKEGEAP